MGEGHEDAVGGRDKDLEGAGFLEKNGENSTRESQNWRATQFFCCESQPLKLYDQLVHSCHRHLQSNCSVPGRFPLLTMHARVKNWGKRSRSDLSLDDGVEHDLWFSALIACLCFLTHLPQMQTVLAMTQTSEHWSCEWMRWK